MLKQTNSESENNNNQATPQTEKSPFYTLTNTPQDFINARDFLLAHRTDYTTAYNHFQWPRMEYFNWGWDYFDKMARNNNKTALWIVGENENIKLSFDQINRRANQVANYLTHLGVKSGDRLMLMLPNTVALWECMLAAIKMNVIIVPSAIQLSTDDLKYRIETASIQHVITVASEIDKFRQLPNNISFTKILINSNDSNWHNYSDSVHYSVNFEQKSKTKSSDPLLYYFTSGTTAYPKLVIHTHQSYTVGHLSTMYWLGVQADTIHMNVATAGWAKHAWSSFFAPWNAGACIFSSSHPRFNVETFLAMLRDYPITSLCAPPTVWRMLRQADLAKYRTQLKEIMSAGEPLNPEIIDEVKKAWGLTIREGYGQTEMTAAIGYCPGQEVIPNAMGQALPGYKLEIIQTGENEELVVNCEPPPVGLMIGYGDIQKTAKVMDGKRYYTGDAISCDKKNPYTFFFIGRKDDVFKSSGYRISPFELESKLIEHAAVLEAAVVGIPHEIKGKIPKAFIVLRNNLQPSPELGKAILEFANSKLAATHRIHELEICPTLPKTVSGKIQRVELRKQENQKTDFQTEAPGLKQ